MLHLLIVANLLLVGPPSPFAEPAEQQDESEPTEEDLLLRARALKVLGILQFAQGKTAEAKKSFAAALVIDPSLTIHDSEAPDTKALALFTSLGGAIEPDETAPPVVGARPPSEAVTQAIPVLGDAFNHRRLGATRLQIDSDVPDALVLIDGVVAGQVGEELDADPGKVEIEVTSPCCKAQVLTMEITKDVKTLRFVRLQP